MLIPIFLRSKTFPGAGGQGGSGKSYLLDTAYAGTTLDSAHSLRRLKSSWNGAAIQVRRSSDNATMDIGFTPSGDLDTATLLTFCGTGNGYVPIWYDQSGNGYHATKATETYQPQIVSAGALLLGHTGSGASSPLPSLYFENQVGMQALEASESLTGTDFTFISVGELGPNVNGSGGPVQCRIWSLHTTEGDTDSVLSTNAIPLLQLFGNIGIFQSGGFIVYEGKPTNSQRFTSSSLFGASATRLRVGSTVVTGGGVSPLASTLVRYGNGNNDGGSGLNGFLSEMIIFRGQMMASDDGVLAANQRAYWSADASTGGGSLGGGN